MASSQPIAIKSCIDFDTFSDTELSELQEKSEHLGKVIGKSQLSTQGNVISLWGRNRMGTIDTLTLSVIDAEEARGNQYHIGCSQKILRVNGTPTTAVSVVLSEIKHKMVIEINVPLSQVTLSNCSDLVLNLKHHPVAGIECINSKDLIICSDDTSFIRATTSCGVRLKGESDDLLLDIRNCEDIYVNNERIQACMFNEGRYRNGSDGFKRLSASKDVFSGKASSLPNMSIRKYF